MSENIIVASDGLRSTSDLSVREAVCDYHDEDVEFLGERSPFESTDDQPTLSEWSA